MKLIYFQATDRKLVADRARSVSDTITKHIIYLTYLNQDEGLRDYWIKELTSKLSSITSKLKKNAKFSYIWYFEPNLSFEVDDVIKYLNNLDDDHKKLCPDINNYEIAISNFYGLMDALISKSNGKLLDINTIKNLVIENIKHI